MKSIFSERQLRARLLEALGWQMVGSGMWEKLSDTASPDVRVDEDEVLEIEQKRIERIQEVFEALSDVVDVDDCEKITFNIPEGTAVFDPRREDSLKMGDVAPKTLREDDLLQMVGMTSCTGPTGTLNHMERVFVGCIEKLHKRIEELETFDPEVREKFRQQDILLCGMREDLDKKVDWLESAITETNKRLEALELASQQWKKLDGRLTTAERRQRTIMTVLEKIHIRLIDIVENAFPKAI